MQGSRPARLVVGISSRALFDLTVENDVYESQKLESQKIEAFRTYQRDHEQQVLLPGGAFPMVRALLGLNDGEAERLVDIVLMSRNHPDISHRIFNSIEHYGLSVRTAALTGGQPLAPYLEAYGVNLFLTRDRLDVQNAIGAGVASGLIYDLPHDLDLGLDEIRLAFDGDGVLFSHEADRIYKEQGPERYFEYERENAKRPLPDGPFAPVLRLIRTLQEADQPKIRIRVALVTARNVQARERALRTLEAWEVRLDEAHFLGQIPKDRVLEVFRPHIFFDDREDHCRAAATRVPTAEVLHPAGKEQLGASPSRQLVLREETRRNRFLLVCKAFVGKDYATGVDKFTLWYRDNLSSWPEDNIERLIEELEVSVQNTPRGEQRRASDASNDKATKLRAFLTPLARKASTLVMGTKKNSDWERIIEHKINQILTSVSNGSDRPCPPVDLDRLRVNFQVIAVEERQMVPEAATEPTLGGFKVYLQNNFSELSGMSSRRRFTLAHEFCHTLFYDPTSEVPTRIRGAPLQGGRCGGTMPSGSRISACPYTSFETGGPIPRGRATAREALRLATKFEVSIDVMLRRVQEVLGPPVDRAVILVGPLGDDAGLHILGSYSGPWLVSHFGVPKYGLPLEHWSEGTAPNGLLRGPFQEKIPGGKLVWGKPMPLPVGRFLLDMKGEARYKGALGRKIS